MALTGMSAFPDLSKRASRLLIQVCVVLLGLRIDLNLLLEAARDGLLFAAGTIVTTFALGLLLGVWLKTGRQITLLITSGTAICGGSAIAAVGAAISATATEMAVATGAVFLLNAGALYLFPVIGHALELSDIQFGTWAGVAIHDVSSVVGAAATYHVGDSTSTAALDTANIVKLSRVLWILPIATLAAWWSRRGGGPGDAAKPVGRRAPVPWFILLFIAASAARTFVPGLEQVAEPVRIGAGLGFQLALFLIGAALSRKAIASVGWRALTQAVVLWAFIAVVSLLVVKATIA